LTEIDLDELREELLQCRRCGICRNAVYEAKGFDGICPVWKNSAGFETDFMRGKIQVALALLDGTLEKSSENAESLFDCTLCGNCTQICASEFDPAHTLEQVREVLNEIPNEIRDKITQKIANNNNPYVKDNVTKRAWVSELGFEIPAKADILYYIGCTAGIKLPEVAKAIAKILKAADVEFAVLEDEPCCGSVLLRTGQVDEAKTCAKKVATAIRNSGAKKVVVSCAGCLKTLMADYPERFGIELPQVGHVIDYVLDLLHEGKIKLKSQEEDVKVTYHDPCHLGRELGIYESPRYLLTALPGINLVEMETNRETAMCCGAGGGLKSYNSDLAKKIGADRVMDAELTGAEVLSTACPFCELNLESGRLKNNSKIRVVDVLELLAERL
jgi:heterodisulfide reductase subunit D